MHAELYCKEEDVESCQVSTQYIHTSCASLLRENYKQVANKKREECSKESISHLEITKYEMEEESKPLGSLPLCFNSFQILKGNLHPEDLLAPIHESHA